MNVLRYVSWISCLYEEWWGRMVVGVTTTYAISAYHHWSCEFESRQGQGLKIFSSEATYPNDSRFNTKISHFVLIQQKTWLPWAIFASDLQNKWLYSINDVTFSTKNIVLFRWTTWARLVSKKLSCSVEVYEQVLSQKSCLVPLKYTSKSCLRKLVMFRWTTWTSLVSEKVNLLESKQYLYN